MHDDVWLLNDTRLFKLGSSLKLGLESSGNSCPVDGEQSRVGSARMGLWPLVGK